MGKQIIALISSDWHYANWKQFNPDEYRLRATDILTHKIIKRAAELGCPILFPGDLVDHPKWIENVVMKYLARFCVNLRVAGVKFYGINGNHDFPKINTFAAQTTGYLTYLSQICKQILCCDFRYHLDKDHQIAIHGIPYLNSNIGFIDALKQRIDNIKTIEKEWPGFKHILMIHRDLAGAVEPDGKIVKKDKDQDEDLKKLFKKFDLVISGHIHKPQPIKALGKNVLMVGALQHQRRSDKGCAMGYWELYSDMTYKFIEMDGPQFRTYPHDGVPGNDTDYWIKLPAPLPEEATKSSSKFNVKKDRKKLAKSFMKAKNVKSKSKLKALIKYIND